MNQGIITIQLHPKNEQRLYAQLRSHQINCLDTTNEIILNTIGAMDDDRNVNYKFTISPCGSTIYTIVWGTISMYNIVTGSVQSSLKVPCVKNRKNSYISHLDYHPKLFLLSAAVYDTDGGIVLLGHKSDIVHSVDDHDHKEAVHRDSFDDRWMLLKQNVNPKSSELLGNIIQRIDNILHQPQRNNKNETDDFKNENIANLNRSDHGVASGGGGAAGYVEIGSLNIISESDSDSVESGGTFTIRNRSISEVSNRTFTLNKNAGGPSTGLEPVNDGTYSIDAGNNSDDTTISESM